MNAVAAAPDLTPREAEIVDLVCAHMTGSGARGGWQRAGTPRPTLTSPPSSLLTAKDFEERRRNRVRPAIAASGRA